ncbi:MAG: hypothetical protein KFF73_19840 [Cyclobacteriaceae bacterium]|nr:hypothetical protein [Cyclobacteriaceae bacterium]
MDKWQRVYADPVMYKAEIVKAVLEEHNLKPVLVNKQDSNYKFGNFEIYVNPDEVIRAIKLINDEIRFG